jgi:syntaxin-binding protein 1
VYSRPVKYPPKKQPLQEGTTNAATIHASSSSDTSILYVFIIGGMTWSEIRSVYEAVEEHQKSTGLSLQIYIGSTHILTPSLFIKDLSTL